MTWLDSCAGLLERKVTCFYCDICQKGTSPAVQYLFKVIIFIVVHAAKFDVQPFEVREAGPHIVFRSINSQMV